MSEALLVAWRMSTDKRSDIMNHPEAYPTLLRIFHFLRITVSWVFLTEGQDGSGGFMVVKPSSLVPFIAKKGKSLFLARTSTSQGFSILKTSKSRDVPPGDKASRGTHTCHLG